MNVEECKAVANALEAWSDEPEAVEAIRSLLSKLEEAEKEARLHLSAFETAHAAHIEAFSRLDSYKKSCEELGNMNDSLHAELVSAKSRLDASQKALGVIYSMAKGLPADLEPNDWLREIQEVCGQVWSPAVERQSPK